MSKATKLVLLAAVLLVATVRLGSQAASAAVKDNGPPTLNVKPSCEAAADRTAMEQVPGSNVRDTASCMRDENEARDQLTKEWAQFSPADRERCTSITKTGGIPSYVELIVCLEMIRDAKGYNGTAPTTGTAPTASRTQRK
jgi:hypothetical protein